MKRYHIPFIIDFPYDFNSSLYTVREETSNYIELKWYKQKKYKILFVLIDLIKYT